LKLGFHITDKATTKDGRFVLDVSYCDWAILVCIYHGWQVFARRWKNPFFSMVKTGLAKILCAGKNRFFRQK